MTNPVGKPEYFSFAQLKEINNAFEGKPLKKEEKVTALKGDLYKSDEKANVLIMPKMEMTKAGRIDSDKMAKRLKEEGVEVKEKFSFLAGVTAKVSKSEAKEIQERGFYVFDDSPQPLLPGIPKATMAENGGKAPWDMPKIEDVKWTGAEKLHEQGITGKGQTVAILDSGFKRDGVELKAYFDAVDGNPTPTDDVGHGTHVAGCVRKTAPDADIVAVKVMGAGGTGSMSSILKGMQWVFDNREKQNIKTVNMSFGTPPDGMPWFFSPINKGVEALNKLGINVVAAAGNSGPGDKTLGSPADVPNAFAIGSALKPDKLSDFSSRGPTDEGTKKPDIVAPGEYIVSWAAPGSEMDQTSQTVDVLRKMTPLQLRKLLTTRPDLIKALGLPKDILTKNDKTLEKTIKTKLPPMYKPTPDTLAAPGTSFASPEVAGIVADLKQINGNLKPEVYKKVLMDTAKNMGEQYNVYEQGAGFVSADKAAEKLK